MYQFVLVVLAYFVSMWTFDGSDSAENNPIRTPNPRNILAQWMTSRKPRLILIADHRPENSTEVQAALHQLGHTVIVAEDGKQAFAAALRYRPDLILVDSDLPLLNGLQTTNCLRKNPTTREIPIIVLAAGDESFTSEHLLAAGANIALAKPAQPQLLTNTITRLLQTA